MRFWFDEARTAQAAAYLVSLDGGEMSYLKLMKLLYLSDREVFVRTGVPITGDRWMSMPEGPILSATLDLIKDRDAVVRPRSPWHSLLLTRPERRSVALRAPVTDLGELSEFHRQILEETFATFGRLSSLDLRESTHEYQAEAGNPDYPSHPIEPRAVLESAGVPADEIDLIEQEAEEEWFMRSLERSA